MAWMNNDGLYVRFGKELGVKAKGGEVSIGERHEIAFTINAADVASASATVLGGTGGGFGVVVPKGAVVEALEITVATAFTSSGTIGSSTLVIGLNKASDRTSALDVDEYTTTSFVGSVLDAVGERTYIVPGVTGAGDGYGVALTENGVIVVANSAHASHPFVLGSARCKLFYRLAD